MDKERLKDLLFSYLNGSMDQEEFDELTIYIKDETYAAVFHESMDHEWQTRKIRQLLSDQEQDSVYDKITADPRFTKAPLLQLRKSRFFNYRLVTAAAAIALIAAGGWLFAVRSGSSTSVYENDVDPGSTKATLTLANGQKITLDDAKKGKLADQLGISVSKTENGQLIYTVAGKSGLSDEISYNTLETPAGGQYQLILPDGTKIWLNAGSSLKYPASFASLKERRVTLKGEAYFEVSHHKDLPFRVQTPKQTVEVLGTHFNVNAYTDEPDTKTTLLEGSVKVLPENKAQVMMLKPGQQAQVGADNEVISIDTESVTAWKNGDFILKDEDFQATMRKIARWYDVEIVYDESAPKDIELGGWVSRSKHISAVLKIIESTGKVHFKVQGRRVTVTK